MLLEPTLQRADHRGDLRVAQFLSPVGGRGDGGGCRIAETAVEEDRQHRNTDQQSYRQRPGGPCCRAACGRAVRRADFVGNALRKIRQHDLALGAGDRTRCEVLVGGALLIPEYRDCGRVGVRLRATALRAQQRPEEHAQRGNEQRPSEKPENEHQQRIPR